MTENKFEASEWISRLAQALEKLAGSVTASRIDWVTLTNEQYRGLGRTVAHDVKDSFLFDGYLPSLNSYPTDVIELLRSHPVVQCTLAGSNDQTAIMMVTPKETFRVEWERLATYLAKSTIKHNGEYAAQILNRYLILSDEKRLPGYEIALFVGLEVKERIELEGEDFLASYDEIVELGLIREPKERGHHWNDHFPDYSAMGAVALVRPIEWGPGITSPKTFKDMSSAPEINFSYLNKQEDIEVCLDLLSIATRHFLDLLSVKHRGDKFMEDLDPNFQQSPPLGFKPSYPWKKKVLTAQDAARFENLLRDWINFNQNRSLLGFAIRRLASSVSRGGRFGLQDGILDISIALEILYQTGNMELSYKLATRAGYFLEADIERRNKVFQKVREFYKIRSLIVHGGNQDAEKLKEAFDEGFALARDTLLKILCKGWPKDWDELVMSGTECTFSDKPTTPDS